MRIAYYRMSWADPVAWTETHRGLGMFDRYIVLAGPYPHGSTGVPTTRKARVQRQGTVNKRQHRSDVLADKG